jgi:Protein of unknown function (DUF3500)
MDEIERHLDQAHFCWIGGYSRDEPFYFKVHSPVTLLEYDNHAAIFLGNREPEKYHTHTVMRTPTATTTARTSSASTTSCITTSQPGGSAS